MRKITECIEMVLLIFYPIGIDLPQHPLGSHFIEATPTPCISNTIGRDLELEAMT